MRTLLLVVVLALVAGSPRPAEACSCARPAVEVTPRGTGAATNARVRLAWPASLALAPGRVALRVRATKAAAGAVVDTTAVSFASADQRVLELVPKQPLAAGTAYEVVAAADDKGKEAIVGTFTTGDAGDTTAPTWKGISKTTYVHTKAVCCNCSTGKPWAELTIAGAADDKSAAEDLRYAVWAPDDQGKLDTTQPPTIIVRAYGGILRLGYPSTCTADNFKFPDQPIKLRIAVAAVDAAGNSTAPADVVIDMTRPAKKR